MGLPDVKLGEIFSGAIERTSRIGLEITIT